MRPVLRVILAFCLLVSVLISSPGSSFAAGSGSTLRQLAKITLPGEHPISDIEIAGNYAYLAWMDARFEGWGLRVVDISDPRAPKLVGGYDIPHAPGTTGQVWAVTVAGSRAYLAAGSQGMRIVDITNPAMPAELGAYAPGPPVDVWDVVVSGTLAYVAARSGGLKVVDVANPSAPVEVNSNGAIQPFELRIAGNTGYALQADQLTALNLTQALTPAISGAVTSAQLQALTFGLNNITLRPDFAFLTSFNCMRGICETALHTVDVSDPVSMTQVNRPVITGSSSAALALAGNAILIPGRNGIGFGILERNVMNFVDASQPSSPRAISQVIQLPPVEEGHTWSMTHANGLIYLGTSTGRFYVFELGYNTFLPSVAK